MQNRPLQPQFLVKLDGVDATSHVAFGMTYEEQPDMITVLDITLTDGLYWLERLKLGHRVELWGGNFKVGNYRKIFNGNIKILRTRFGDDGRIEVLLNCYDTLWAQAASSANHFRYPSKNSLRGWAGAEKIRASDMVRNLISKEMGLEIGEISIANDREYSWKYPLSQDNATDWAFLRKMAKLLGCFVWAENTNDSQRINFVDIGKAVSYAAKTEFAYVLRDEKGNYLTKSLEDGVIPIRGVTVEEDTSMAFANRRIITKFDPLTGNEAQLISRYDEEKRTVYYYKLDEGKVAALRRDNPQEADRLLAQGPTGISETDYLKYYTETSHMDDESAVFDTPFLGLTVRCTIDGDVSIRSQQSYIVRNIARYGSQQRTGRYLLRGLKHRWEEEGFITELEFMR